MKPEKTEASMNRSPWSEVDELDDVVHERVPQGDQGIEGSVADTVEQAVDELVRGGQEAEDQPHGDAEQQQDAKHPADRLLARHGDPHLRGFNGCRCCHAASS